MHLAELPFTAVLARKRLSRVKDMDLDSRWHLPQEAQQGFPAAALTHQQVV